MSAINNYELLFYYIGYIVCFLASLYLTFYGHKISGLLIAMGFFLEIQSIIYREFIFMDESNIYSCLAQGKDIESCYSLIDKISVHAAQIGYYIIASGIFILTKHLNRTNK